MNLNNFVQIFNKKWQEYMELFKEIAFNDSPLVSLVMTSALKCNLKNDEADLMFT